MGVKIFSKGGRGLSGGCPYAGASGCAWNPGDPVRVRFRQDYEDLANLPTLNGRVLKGDFVLAPADIPLGADGTGSLAEWISAFECWRRQVESSVLADRSVLCDDEGNPWLLSVGDEGCLETRRLSTLFGIAPGVLPTISLWSPSGAAWRVFVLRDGRLAARAIPSRSSPFDVPRQRFIASPSGVLYQVCIGDDGILFTRAVAARAAF